MPHGRGHNKGFEYYMCKKFFHPNNPQNLERVWMKKQELKAKEEKEADIKAEYEKEQELWKNRKLHGKFSNLDKDKMSLNFMYEPPPGAKKVEKVLEKCEDGEMRERDGSSASICYKCNKVGHFARECKGEMAWQRGAPREESAKGNPNVADHAFGMVMSNNRCMKCHVWGHSHTDKFCPRYGKARDHEEPPEEQVDPEQLVRQMQSQGLKWNTGDVWDNGKIGKKYDMVYSSDEEQEDLLVSLVKKIKKENTKTVGKTKKKKKSHSRSRSRSSIRDRGKSRRKRKSGAGEDSDSGFSGSKAKKKKKKGTEGKKDERRREERREEKKERKKRKKKRRDEEEWVEKETIVKKETMEKIDDILFANIVENTSRSGLGRETYMEEVDRILEVKQEIKEEVESEEDAVADNSDRERRSAVELWKRQWKQQQQSGFQNSDNHDSSSEEEEQDNTEELTEAEMRLLNLISVKKIDVKDNFPIEYRDTACHFCRARETMEHLAACPVYEGIMRGSEFSDIHSANTRLVKTALENIRLALEKRSEALAVTSVGRVSQRNMALLTLAGAAGAEQARLIDQILNTAA